MCRYFGTPADVSSGAQLSDSVLPKGRMAQITEQQGDCPAFIFICLYKCFSPHLRVCSHTVDNYCCKPNALIRGSGRASRTET